MSAIALRLENAFWAFGDNIDWAPYEERELTRYTVNTILTYEDLKEEIDKVRRRGYAMDHEEQEMGLTCIGAPILDRNKKGCCGHQSFRPHQPYELLGFRGQD